MTNAKLKYLNGLVVIGLACVLGTPLHAQTLNMTVDSTVDEVDGFPGDGRCMTDSGTCTLRAAIQEANAFPSSGPHWIFLPANLYVISLGAAGSTEDGALSGDLDVRSSINLIGAGAQTTIVHGNGLDRVFDVFPGFTVTLKDLSVTGGVISTVGDGGAGIRNAGTLTVQNCQVNQNRMQTYRDGGGIYNAYGANLKIINSSVNENAASHGGGIFNLAKLDITGTTMRGNNSGAYGGAINDGGNSVITIKESTITANQAKYGGGLYVDGMLTMTNVTVSGNSAGEGGALWAASRSVQLINCTFSNNTSGGIAGLPAIYLNSGTASMRATIVNEYPLGCKKNPVVTSTKIISQGFNLDRKDTCGFYSDGDKRDTDPMLAPLAYNGGLTQTHALLAGSPAINVIPQVYTWSYPLPRNDQRGVARPQYPNAITQSTPVYDIGAFEYEFNVFR